MSADPVPETVAVAPTLTLVCRLDVRSLGLITLQVANLDVAQTFSGFIRRSVSSQLATAVTTFGDFASIPPAGSTDGSGNPTDSVTADIDTEGSAVLELWGQMSGAGGDVEWAARKAGIKR